MLRGFLQEEAFPGFLETRRWDDRPVPVRGVGVLPEDVVSRVKGRVAPRFSRGRRTTCGREDR